MSDSAPAALPERPFESANPMTFDPELLPSWRRIEADASACTSCGLHEHRTKAVVGAGPQDAELVILGAGPGRHEDVQGQPFLGAAGNVLTNALADAGLDRDEVFITNLVKCHPPDRLPEPAEVESCSPFLFAQLSHVRPRVIVTLGELPTAYLLRRRMPLDKIAGYRLDVFDGVTLIPTYDPSLAVKGSTQAMAAIRRDLMTAKAVLDGRLSTGKEALADAIARQEQQA